MTNSSANHATDHLAEGKEAALRLEIRLLGSPTIRRGGEPVTGFRSAKAQALLYYLAARSQPVMRATLLNLFWAEGAEEQGRTNLNQTLSNLRKVLGDVLLVTRQAVALDLQQVQLLDVRELAAAAHRAQTLEVELLLEAAALYRGDLLEGFQVRDAAEFELWLGGERERLREAAITLLVEAARRHEAAGDVARTQQALRALLRIEPWRESAHRQLMLLLARNGARDAALAQYAALRQALAGELDVEPDAETERLYAAIRSGEIAPARPSAWTGATGSADAKSPAHPAPPVVAAGAPAHNLPRQSTPFVGRSRELAEVVQRLGDADCRLLTLVGPGGIGKSRLALQAAQLALEDGALAPLFADGIFFVALAAVDTADGVLASVAEVVGLQFYDHTPAHQQVVAFLASKRMLLVLDNLEQLVAGADADSLLQWLSDVLMAAAGVKLLATTREGVALQEAWFYPLAGLSLPPSEPADVAPAHPLTRSPAHVFAGGWLGEDAVEQSDAVRLFVQSARRARVGFSLSTTHEAVTRICRLVDGAPLAIELAAAWLKVLTADQVAAELERSLDILTARHQNAPARHRSMRAVCESSWQLLAQPLREMMQRLALHRGGFRRETAAAVAGASLFDLATLVEKSLLRQADNGRYEMHELLRQYALEQLAQHGQAGEERRRHAAYYLRFLQERGGALAGAAQRQALEVLAEEQENLHAAWQAAVEAQQWELVADALAALHEFFQVRSSYWEGQALLVMAANGLAASGAAAPDEPARMDEQGTSTGAPLRTPRAEDGLALLARLHARQGAFAFHLGRYSAAVDLAAASLAQARRLNLPADAAFALCLLGQIAGWRGEREEARRYLQESLALCRAAGDRAGAANALHKLAQVSGSVGDYAEARRHAEESLALCRQLGRPDWIGYALDVLGWVTLCLGDYAACTDHYSASLRLFRDSGDRLGTALALGGLGSVEWARGGERLPQAAAYMAESLNLCRAIGHRHHAASRLWYLGQIAIEQGDFGRGRAYGEEGKALAEEVGSRVFVSYNLCSLGAAEGGLGNPGKAQDYLISVLYIASEVAHLPPLLIALIELARLCVPDAPDAARRQLGRAALADVIGHPACWQPFRERAQRLAAVLGAAGAPAPPVLSLEGAVAAWQELAI